MSGKPEDRLGDEAGERISSSTGTSQAVSQLLDRLRGRIRRYVTIEGIASAVAFGGAVFVFAIALDYLPILFGLSELPRLVRGALALLLLGGMLVILFRQVVLRRRVRMSDRSMALLIERYHREFQESLVTTAERPTAEDETAAVLLSRARAEAEQLVDRVDLGRIFDRSRLTRVITTAMAAVVAIAMIGLMSPAGLGLGARRLLLLDETPWPRSNRIEVVGVRLIQEVPNPVLSETSGVLPFEEGKLRVAKGTRMVLLVRAAVPSEAEPELEIPSRCTVSYRMASGERGFQYMDKVGQPRDGFQWFELDKSPFEGVSEDLVFDVRGDDHRVTGNQIEIVDAPAVVQGEVDCRFPEYMVDQETGSWTPRSLPLLAGTKIPIGTEAEFVLTMNKPLRQAWAYNPATQKIERPVLEGEGQKIRFDLGTINESASWEFTFEDQDGVIVETPYRAEVLAVPDQAPKVQTRLAGIGDAITPEARLPIAGKIEDDFGVARSWIELGNGAAEPLAEEIPPLTGKEVSAALDLREKRQAGDEAFRFEPDAGVKLQVTVVAEDRFNLGAEPNRGRGDVRELEVVSASQLLRRLERREAAQRRLVEQIHDELTEAHNLLVRIRGLAVGDAGAEPGDKPAEVDPTVADLSLAESHVVFAQRVKLQLQKSRQELTAVADTFDDIRLQLINNRVDSEERKARIETQIVNPLRTLLSQRFVTADASVEKLRGELDAVLRAAGTGETPEPDIGTPLEEMQLLLVELDDILQEMLQFESYNELLDVVRELIRQQEGLLQETEKERKRRAFEDLIQ